MAFAARSRGCDWTACAGSEVRTTPMVRVVGSAHAIVPVDPVWPNDFSEPPLPPAEGPTFQPNPRGASPGPLWFRVISLAVSGFTQAPVGFRNSVRSFARSGAEAWVPPQGVPSCRHQGLFQSQSFAFGSPPPDSGAACSVWQGTIVSSLNRPSPWAECCIWSG